MSLNLSWQGQVALSNRQFAVYNSSGRELIMTTNAWLSGPSTESPSLVEEGV